MGLPRRPFMTVARSLRRLAVLPLAALLAAAGLDIETATATFEKARANVGAMEAAKARSQLYLDYTRVLSPVSGRVSRRFIDPGNLINADMTLLTTVVDESQVYAYFDVDERT